uniref:Secreted protein n=1 Tax=Parascaris univalens TaxID=6257 RepID=A0A914ZX25_PARUN
MQSRLAMSGLSLCLITITLLWISVVTRRRRIMLAASHFERMANERLLREQQRQLCERRAVAIQVAMPKYRVLRGVVQCANSDTLCRQHAMQMCVW